MFETVKDVFDPANTLTLFANIFCYIVMQTLFFYYVASGNIEGVMEDKASFVAELAEKDPTMKEAMMVSLRDAGASAARV